MRWEPWVRSYLMAQELIEGMRFATDNVKAGTETTQRTVLSILGPAGAWVKTAELVRPPARVFREQVDLVLSWAELREERAPEILTQIDNQHAFWGTVIPFHTERLRYTRELIEAAVQMAVFVVLRFKHELAAWRPADLSAQVQPMISTPGHGSFPSGHCTQSYVVYEVLRGLLNSRQQPRPGEQPAYQSLNTQLRRIAERVSTNRVIAGVHFPVDNIAGRALGVALGEYFLVRCGEPARVDPAAHVAGQPWSTVRFDGRAMADGREDFNPAVQDLFGSRPAPYYGYLRADPQAPPAQTPVLRVLWQRARGELDALGLVFD
jgi:membrane-associated phospholipid phosphatase